MLKVYKMPNGRKYQYEDGKVPEGAVLVGPMDPEPIEVKVAPKPKNKSRKTENKSK